MVQVAYTLEYVAYLLMLDFQLGWVGDMLVLAAATLPEVLALRLNPVWGRDNHPQETRPAKPLLHLDHLNFHGFSEMDERNEDHEILYASNAFSSEGDVANCHGQLIACNRIHWEDARKLRERKKDDFPGLPPKGA
jgi:hypothetical protein